MKRIVACMLLAVISLGLSGCLRLPEDEGDTITLFYIRSEHQYHGEDNVIVGEVRGLSPKTETAQLLELYLSGPVDDSLISPFPKGAEVVDIQEYSGLLEITLSDTGDNLSDVQFSLACVCLGKTLMEDPSIIQVTVLSGDRTMTVSRDNYLLTDEVGTTESTKEAMP